ncbi:hypothetical protein M406DRAFT_249494, partial [Cryphonectria parasitica EP155]
LYALSAAELEMLRKYLEKMLIREWIRFLTSSASILILFVLKKEGKLCLCMNYRALNQIICKNCIPLPLIAEILNRLSYA